MWQSFTLPSNLKRHQRIHTGKAPFECKICGRRFCFPSRLSAHMQCHTAHKPYKCWVCEKRFRRSNYLSTNMRFHTGEKLYKCEICEKKFTQSSHLTYHMRIHTGDIPYKCKSCGKSFTQTCSLKTHYKTHTGVKLHKCEICKKRFSRSSCLSDHMKIHTGDKPYDCGTCGLSFTYPSQLKKHLRTHLKHSLMHTGENLHKCEICMKMFTQSWSLSDHMRIHTGEKPYECGSCGMSFYQVGNLKRHLRTHTGIKPLTCFECKQSFSFAGMQYHQLHVHKDTKADTDCHIVKQCEQAVSSEVVSEGVLQRLKRLDKSTITIKQNSVSNYDIAEKSTQSTEQEDATKEQHMLLPPVIQISQTVRYESCPKSNKFNQFICVICNKSLATLSYFTEHMVSHRVKRHFCETCGKSFTLQTDLRNHKHIHTGEKPYTCDFCGRSFTSSSDLLYHMRHHTGDKPYTCKSCGKLFMRIGDLKTHYLTRVCVKQPGNAAISMEQNLARNSEMAEMRIESLEKLDETKQQKISELRIIPDVKIKRQRPFEETKNDTEDPKLKQCDRAVNNKIKFKRLINKPKQFDNAYISTDQSSALKNGITETSKRSIAQTDSTPNTNSPCLLEPINKSMEANCATKFCNLDVRRRIAISVGTKRNNDV